MSQPVTIEDIYRLFQRSQEEFDRRMAESKAEFDRRMAESKAEFDRRMAEFKVEADRRDAEFKAEADRRAAEADRRAAEADRRAAEADRRDAEFKAEAEQRLARLEQIVERTSRAVDGLSSRWGRFVEELVEPAVIRLFQERGIDVKEVYPRARTRRQGWAMEIDILAVDDDELVLVECKSRLSIDDVNEFLLKLERFKLAFTHYQNYRVYGAVAGIEINEGVDRYAYQRGLFVIKPSGDTVEIINDQNFQPTRW